VTRSFLRWLFRRVVQIYFREIEIVGELPDVSVGGRIFAANHVNGLVDPILVLTTSPCVVSPIGKAPLWKIPVLRWLLEAVDAVPIVRRRDDPGKTAAANDEVFAKVAAHLGKGGNILIFPEGTSHNEPHLVPLRSGAGRMLAKAHEGGARGLTFQSVGLEFEARDIFRSRTLVVYGPVRHVDELAQSGAGVDALAAAIMQSIQRDLADLVVEGATWDERLLIARVAEMFASDAGDLSLAGWNAIGQKVEIARAALASNDGALYAELSSDVSAYYTELERAGFGDSEVAAGKVVGKPGGPQRAVLLAAIFPLAVIGMALYFLPYQVPRIASRAADDADVVSTYKLGAGLVAHPLWATLLGVTAFLMLPRPLAWTALAVILLSPFAALAWLDRADRLQRRLRTTVLKTSSFERLRASRRAVMAKLDSARVRLESAPAPLERVS
jgi:hypothetical protein